jgi:hypothetical protein
MESSRATSVDEYLSNLPPQRRDELGRLRRLILQRLPAGYEESMQFGMIGYTIPLARYPKTYNGQPLMLAALASQKQHMALYLSNVYGQPDRERRLREAFRAAGKTLDMGKSCVRFKTLEDLALDAIAEVIAGTSVDEHIAEHEAARSAVRKRPARAAKKKTRAVKKARAAGARAPRKRAVATQRSRVVR